VVDPAGRLVGIVSRIDLLKMFLAVAAVEGVVRVVNRLGYEIVDLAPVAPEGLARPVP
jgi:hypothetical protein